MMKACTLPKVFVWAFRLSFLLGATAPAENSVPDGLTASDWSSIRAVYDAGRHAVHQQDDGSHAARNPGQRWRTTFDGRGFLVTPDHGGWTWGMELQECDGQTRASAAPRVATDGNTITYHWSEQLEEWFVNDRRGLEQGWTIRERFGSHESPLTLTFTLHGGLVPAISSDQLSIAFQNPDGTSVLTYDGLKAWDAEETPLEVRFARGAGDRSLGIEVDDAGAVYPITIDPVAQQQAYLKASSPIESGEAGDEFGRSVAVSGDTVVIGARKEDSNAKGVGGNPANNGAADSGAAYVFVRSGNSWVQQAYLKASNTEAGDAFGWAVGISGDTVVVGATGEGSAATGVDGDESDNGAVGAGAAYVFVRSGTTWSQQAYLKASNTGADDSFGWSVAVGGDTVVVGAPAEDSNATGVGGDETNNSAVDSGAVYVFVRSGTTWSQQEYVKASNAGGRLGQSVAISGNTVVAGAIGENTGPNNSGAAYVFVRSGTAWSEEAFLKAPDPGANDSFGFTVAVSGDTLVIGAYQEDSASTGVDNSAPFSGGADNSASNAGAAYVFARSGTTWNQQAYLKASNTDAGDYFGYSVSISGETVVVGATREASAATGVGGNENDNSTVFAGAAYVFVRSGTTWSQEAYLKASNTGGSDLFGFSVAVSGDSLVVGVPLEDGPLDNANSAGASYAFSRSGTTWSEEAYLKASFADAEDSFGRAVAVAGDTVVIGAPGEDSAATGINGDGSDDSASASGAVYVFVRSGVTWSQQAYVKASNSEAGDDFGNAVAISGETLVVGAPVESSAATGVDNSPPFSGGADNSASASGAVYVFVRSGETWSQQAYVKASNSEAGDRFGFSVAISGETLVVGAQNEGSSATGVNANESDNSASSSGAAYVFVRSGVTWSQQAYLKASNTEADDTFGFSVAISSETIVVGASGEDSAVAGVDNSPPFSNGNDNGAPGAGAAYVFVRSGTMWSQQAYLKASNPGTVAGFMMGDGFGLAVAVSGDTIVVGAPAEASTARGVNGDESDDSSLGAGAAYVFVRSGTVWSQEAYLKASNTNISGSSFEFFGGSVAISGRTAIVGAYWEASAATGVNGDGEDNSAGEAGAAYVFVRGGTTWHEEAFLKASNTGAGDDFGFAVAASMDTIVVGAPGERSATTGVDGDGSNNSALRSGAAYVFAIPAGPEIRVEHPGATVVTSGGTVDFGPLVDGENFPEFVVSNIGSADLTGVAASLSGTDAGKFSITTIPAGTLPPNDSTILTVKFTPPGSFATGSRNATLNITSNDGDENPFTIDLTGTELSFSSDSDGDGLNDASEWQLMDLGFDWEDGGAAQEGLVDTLFDNAAGAGLYTTSQVQDLYAPTPVIARNPGTGKFTLTMDWMKSTDAVNFFDFRADEPGSGVTVNPTTGDIEFTFDSPDPAAFFRVEVE